MFAWNGVSSAWRIGGWIGIAIVLAAVAAFVVLRRRRESV
jgi:LPXTG-motif cell wall-anchored protein